MFEGMNATDIEATGRYTGSLILAFPDGESGGNAGPSFSAIWLVFAGFRWLPHRDETRYRAGVQKNHVFDKIELNRGP
jgi:hypothetical protein